MVRVFDEAKSLGFYARAFGLKIAERIAFPDFALVYLRHASSPFELNSRSISIARNLMSWATATVTSRTLTRWRPALTAQGNCGLPLLRDAGRRPGAISTAGCGPQYHST